jgi:nitroreductase
MNQKRSARPAKKNAGATRAIQGLTPIALPEPKPGRGGTVLIALRRRRTTRTISDKKLSLQALSNLLWAAFGVNRKKGPFGVPGRTAGSASNSREIDIYVALSEGTYMYEAATHKLIPVASGDLRALAIGPGQQGAGANAPVRLMYVADLDRFSQAGFQEPGLYDPEIQKSYYYVDTGLIAENVYLFASSEGLATWFHNCDRLALAKRLNLRTTQRALFGQTVGYPAKTARRKAKGGRLSA